MTITKQTVAEKVAAYLHHEIGINDLVDWAENAMMDGEFDEEQLGEVRDAIARLGLADVRAFGLTWEGCENLLKDLGYSARVEISAAR